MIQDAVKIMPMLYGLATNGKIKTVQYYVKDKKDGTFAICNEHGYIDGMKQVDERIIVKGKNIGKSNETTAEQQAISEMESRYQKKLDENYTTNESGIPDASEQSLLPMLAHKFQERGHNIKYPCLVQPKLNGVRCMAKFTNGGKVNYTSRKDKPYNTVSHLDKDFIALFEEHQFNGRLLPELPFPADGEIYKHGLTLQEINRRVKKDRGADTQELEYWIYDLGAEELTNEERAKDLDFIFRNFSENVTKIMHVPTFIVKSAEEIKKYHDKFVQQGFEGVIIRNMDGKYLFDKRSSDLQKFKEFQDDEFEVVGYTSGEGRETDAIIFVCKTKDGKEFNVRPRGPIPDRIKMMSDNPKQYIGLQYTVRYFDLTEDGLPSFPVGIGFRLEEDLPD